MIYVFVLLILALLGGVTVFFFVSLKSIEVPPNVRLVIDAWNLVQEDSAEIDNDAVLSDGLRENSGYVVDSLR